MLQTDVDSNEPVGDLLSTVSSGRRQVDTIRAVIKKELELPIVEVLDPKATLDGGDVLFTGESPAGDAVTARQSSPHMRLVVWTAGLWERTDKL